MNSKQRAFLRGLAMNIQPILNIGKGGITDNVVMQLDQALESRELIKIQVLKNADFSASDVLDMLAKATNSQAVQAIGGKITLYRVSKSSTIKHIELPV